MGLIPELLNVEREKLLTSQTMGLSTQAFSPTHGSTMLHSLVYIKNMHEPYKSEQNLLGEPETEEQHAYITENFIG